MPGSCAFLVWHRKESKTTTLETHPRLTSFYKNMDTSPCSICTLQKHWLKLFLEQREKRGLEGCYQGAPSVSKPCCLFHQPLWVTSLHRPGGSCPPLGWSRAGNSILQKVSFQIEKPTSWSPLLMISQKSNCMTDAQINRRGLQAKQVLGWSWLVDF